MKNVNCLECANEIGLEQKKEYKIGSIIECPFCGTELEVVEIKGDKGLILDIIEEEK